VASHAGAAQEAPSDPAPATDAEYRIGPGDLLALSVLGAPELDVRARVSNSGRIHVPFVGVIHVADLSVRELEADLGKRLRESGLIQQPWVSVRINQYRAQPVYILGEVMMPGQFIMKEEMRVADLIIKAIGLATTAGPVGYLYRRKDASAGPMSHARLLHAGKDSRSILLPTKRLPLTSKA
jgi:polysaccharide biosynthesis/export protein